MHKPLHPMSYRAQLGLRFTEAPPEGGEQPPQGGAGGSTPPADIPKTFTQAEVSALAAREKGEGKAAAERSISEQLGVTIAEAKDIIAAARKADDATKSDAQKDREAAAREKAEAETDRANARKEVHDTRLERAFDKLGIDLSAEKDREKNLRLLRLVTTEVGASYDDILADVKKIQTDFPALFPGAEEAGKPPARRAPGSDPAGKPPAAVAGEEKYAAGQKRAQARYAQPEGAKENPLVAASRR